MARRSVRMGVIGLGMGSGHAVAYQALPDAKLTAICDVSEPWLEHCKTQWGVKLAFTDADKLLASPEVDAVSIAVPTHLHAAVTQAALRAGKHVLVEKPMAASAAEGRAMVEAARAAGRNLMVSYNQRFGADMQYLKRLADEGHFGSLYFVRTVWRRPLGMLPAPRVSRPTRSYDRNWFNEAARGGGVALDLGSHMLDLALWLLGFPPVAEVSGSTYAMFGPEWARAQGAVFDADDHTVGFVRFATGASLQVEVSFGSHTDREVIELEVFGSEGGALRRSGQPLRLFGALAGAYTTLEPRLADAGSSAQAEFVASILEKRESLCTAEQGLAALEIIDGLRAAGPPVRSV